MKSTQHPKWLTGRNNHPFIPSSLSTLPLSLLTPSSTPTLTPQIPIHVTQNQTTHSTPIESNSNALWYMHLRWTRNRLRFDSARTVRYPLFQVVSVSHSPTSLSIDSMQIRFNTLSGTWLKKSASKKSWTQSVLQMILYSLPLPNTPLRSVNMRSSPFDKSICWLFITILICSDSVLQKEKTCVNQRYTGFPVFR